MHQKFTTVLYFYETFQFSFLFINLPHNAVDFNSDKKNTGLTKTQIFMTNNNKIHMNV